MYLLYSNDLTTSNFDKKKKKINTCIIIYPNTKHFSTCASSSTSTFDFEEAILLKS